MMIDWGMTEGEGSWKILEKNGGKISSIASHKKCVKECRISKEELIGYIESMELIKGFIFMASVKGVGPNFEDAFSCRVVMKNERGEELLRVSYKNHDDYSLCNKDSSSTSILIQHTFIDLERETLLP